MDEKYQSEEKANGARSPTRNGTITRPDYDRTDTTQSGWATENEDEKVLQSGEHGSRHTVANIIQPAPPQQSESEKKRQTFITRAIWTFVMIAIFFGSMFAGHIYVIIIVTAIQIISFKEVIAIANVPSRARSLRFTKTLNWYFLGTTMYFLYGESVIYYFKHIVLIDRVLLPFATHHRFISFMLYVMGMSYEEDPTGKTLLTSFTRICVLCDVLTKGPLPVPVHTIRMDPHGALLDRCTGTLHYEQHLRGNDLVLPARQLGHHQRHLCLRLWNHIRENTAYQAEPEEDS